MNPARQTFRLPLVLAALLVAGAGGALAWRASDAALDARCRRMLASSERETRKRGAWEQAGRPTPGAQQVLRDALRQDRESDPDVREAFVYALGRGGKAAAAEALLHVLRTETQPVVRHAAWVAIERVDAERFRAALAADGEPNDPWEQIGVAYARLEQDDPRGAPVLLHWAAAGDDAQRRVASQALYRTLAPLLEIAGRWPGDVAVREGQTWPAEAVAQVAGRCAGLDLAAIAADSRRHAALAAPIRRNVAKLTRARETVAALLFGGVAGG